MSSKDSVSSTTNRKKQKKPSYNQPEVSLPDLSSETGETCIFTDSKEMKTDPSTNTGPGPCKETLTVRTYTPTSDFHPHLIQTEGQTYNLPTLTSSIQLCVITTL